MSDISVFGERLKRARKIAGLSMQELADNMENLISKQALSRYETGVMEPTGKVVLALAAALNVTVDYFFKKDTVALGELSFRKRIGLPKKEEDAIIEKTTDCVERYLELEDILHSEIKFENPLTQILISSLEDIEQAAQKLRDEWMLGTAPLSNILQLMEEKGIKVFVTKVSGKFDGIATATTSGIPVVVINEASQERMRFTAVHELAHLLLNLAETIKNDYNETEKYCHYFASNFLVPKVKFFELLGSKRNYISIDEFLSIKETYGISIRAQVYRAWQLNIINETYRTKWIVFLTKKFGSKGEPGSYSGIEKPQRFDQLLNRALGEEIISVSKAASLADVSVSQLTKQLNESPK